LANTALIMPASANTIELSSTAVVTTSRLYTCRRVKISVMVVTTAPTIRPRRMPPTM
jgi:hypothetical protein